MRNSSGSRVTETLQGISPRGITAVGVFWFFGTVMASFAGITLLWPGTVLDHVWALNASAHAQLVRLGRAVGVMFLILGIALAFAGVGWFRRRAWGWTLAVIIVATQVLGDLVNVLMGQFVRGGTGAVIAGMLLFYLFRPKVKQLFS